MTMSLISTRNKTTIAILSVLHLLCDLICGYKVIGILAIDFYDYGFFIFVIYNTLAFCFQPFIGLYVDRYHQEKRILLASLVFLAIGLFINIWWLSAILLGIGNQIFHVAGGKVCTNISTEKSSHLGIFVSLGAIGLAIGGNLYQYRFIPYVAIALYFFLTLASLWLIEDKTENLKTNDKPTKPLINKQQILLSVMFLLIAVFIRSFLGKIIHYEFEINLKLLLLLPASAALGKFIGGFIRDKWGSFYTILVSMTLTAMLLLFFAQSKILMMLGLVMINISMPITLFELNKLLPGKEGFNFGILAGILFPGVVIGMLYNYHAVSYAIVVLVSSLLAILSMYYIKRGDLRG
jgi:MFS family permease